MTDKSKIMRGLYDKEVQMKKSVGENIALLRKLNGMTQKELAEKTFMNVSKIKNIEKDAISVTQEDMERICENLQVSVMALFFKIRVDMANCDERTGLTNTTIVILKKLNQENKPAINMLNRMFNHKRLKLIVSIINLIMNCDE